MKKILFSLLLSFAAIVAYVLTLFGLVIGDVITDETSKKLAKPLQLPSYVYHEIFLLKDNYENGLLEVIVVMSAVVINIIIYAIPIYILLSLLIPKKRNPDAGIEPPLPPTF